MRIFFRNIYFRLIIWFGEYNYPSSEKAIFMQTLYMYFHTDLIYFHMWKHRKSPFFHGDFPWRCEAFSVEFWGDLYNDFSYWKYSYLSVKIFSKLSFIVRYNWIHRNKSESNLSKINFVNQKAFFSNIALSKSFLKDN